MAVNKSYRYLIGFLVCTTSFCVNQVLGQSISVGGSNWTVPVNVITEAGLDYTNGGTVESPANQILINVNVSLLLGHGNVSIHYVPNGIWNNNLKLSAKRTGTGTTACVLCTVAGGDNYLPLTQIDQSLFTVNAVLSLAAYSNIPIQVKISGLSVTIPADSYSSNIVFTISSN